MDGRRARLIRTLTTARPVSLPELVAITGLLALLAAATFTRHIADGGFWSDDWANAADYRFTESPRYPNSVSHYADLLGSRPVLALLLPLPYAIVGLDPTPHLVMGIVLGVLTCVCFYLFLRAIPMAPLHAGAIASFALVFPWADSIRLWPTASINTIALVFAFLGGFAALRGIAREGTVSTVSLVAAACLYVASVLTYEVAGVALLLVGALYLRHAPRRKALRWWAIHAAAVAAALVYTLLTTEKNVGTIGDRLGELVTYTRQGISLFSYSFAPPGVTSVGPRIAGLLLTVAIVTLGLWRYRSRRDAALGFWLAFTAGAGVAVASAYIVLLGSSLEPLREGAYNRGNLFAAFGFVAVVYGLAMIAVRAAEGHRVVAIVAGVAVLLVGAGYVVRVNDDSAKWTRAWRLQQPVVDAAVNAAANLPTGATILTFGYPSQVSEGIPIFYASWDLDGATKLALDVPSASGFPIYDSVTLTCGDDEIDIKYPHSGGEAQPDYRSTAFVDVPTGAVRRVRSASECRAALRSFRPGPEYADEPTRATKTTRRAALSR